MSVTMTEAAAKHVTKYLSRRGKGVGVRLGVKTIRENVAKLRELSPLWEMYKDGIDLNTIQWAAH